MFEVDPSRDLVVETPELVAFQYELAGLGTRFLAQAIDACLLGAVLVEIALLGFLVAALSNGYIGASVGLLLGFLAVFGYFLGLELAWSGQTPGKRALRIRVVGTRGEPVTRAQVVTRNLLRLVDFLPFYYAAGVITMFANGQSRRLGDLAAGTLVVREREQALSLGALEARLAEERPLDGRPLAALEPNLRRLVLAYAGRRAEIQPGRRAQIAESAGAALAAAAPAAYAEGGALAALDRLAELAAGEERPARLPVPPAARMALGFGIATCVVALWCMPAVLLFGALALWQRRRALRAAGEAAGPAVLAYTDTARLLAFAGLIAGLSIIVTFGLALLAGSFR